MFITVVSYLQYKKIKELKRKLKMSVKICYYVHCAFYMSGNSPFLWLLHIKFIIFHFFLLLSFSFLLVHNFF